MDGLDEGTLAKMPLAEAVLTIWRYVADEDRLQSIFERCRGRCYEQSISFATLVQLVADALLAHRGSGRQSFCRAQESGELSATTRAAYGKLGRLPIALSVGWFDELSAATAELYPATARRQTAESLKDFSIVTIDGKTIKRVAKRLKPLRGVGGGVIGGKALVATDYGTGLACALAATCDGDANDARLVPELLPRVRARLEGRRLWVADRGFGDPLQISRFAEQGDSFVLRYNAKAKFTRDEAHEVREGKDREGRTFVDERGWLGRVGNQQRRHLRRITLRREGEEDVAIVTDLVDQTAGDLLDLYRERWGIERMFQQVTEVFGLERLIGGRPEATIFQLAFCLLLYNQTQLVRAYAATCQDREPEAVSLEQLFVDVRRELIAWSVVVGPVDLPRRSSPETRRRLNQLLKCQWSDRWLKTVHRSTPPNKRPPRTKTHTSAYRALNPAKA